MILRIRAIRFVAFKGATAYEAQLMAFYVQWPYWRYIKVGCRPKFGWDKDWRS